MTDECHTGDQAQLEQTIAEAVNQNDLARVRQLVKRWHHDNPDNDGDSNE